MDYTKLSELLFSDLLVSADEILKQYPARVLPEKAAVTRFAPSPTGYMHIGGLYAALISMRMANQSGGVFYLRLEDTDKKREVEKGADEIINSLAQYGIVFDEGAAEDGAEEKGNYGPYRQSLRRDIYRAFAKELVKNGYAYPCFCSEEELNQIRSEQESKKADMGYYGEYARCRNLTLEEIEENIKSGKEYVLRLRNDNNPEDKVICRDIIRGKLEMPASLMDVVLLKSDGIPTYHYAHAIDDFLMGTTHVIRGDEWISSYPIHAKLFEVSGFKLPQYAHIAPIMKLDGGENKKRKLSKRKDPEAAVSYYSAAGYPVESVIEYLMTIANSGYEEWRMKNPDAAYSEYKFKLEKMPVSGALFDMDKLNSVSRDVIAKMPEDKLFTLISEWAAEHDKKLSEFIEKDAEAFKASIPLWKYNGKKVRKDIAKWSDLSQMFPYIYGDGVDGYDFDDKIDKTLRCDFIKAYLEGCDGIADGSEWFSYVKKVGEPLGFCPDIKEYKKNPEMYKGSVADACTVLRVAITGKRNSPDLYSIINLIGKDEACDRLNKAMSVD